MVYRGLLHILFICIAYCYSSCQEANINKELEFTNLLDTVLKQHKKLLNQLDSAKLNINIETCEDRIALMEYSEINGLQKQWLKEEINAYENIKTLIKLMRTDLNFLEDEFTYSKNQIQYLKQDLIHRHLSNRFLYIFLSGISIYFSIIHIHKRY
jgi:regulator of sirC expression with transglutaminase-like and TPR domain